MLGIALRAERKRQNLSQACVERRIGIDRSRIRLIERGEYDITFETLMKMLQGLNAQPGPFLTKLCRQLSPPTEVAGSSRSRVRLSVGSGMGYAQILGAAVRCERELAKALDRRLDQKEVAKRIGTARSNLSAIENGLGNPSFTLLMAIPHGLGIPPAELFRHIPLLATSPVNRS